MAGRAKGSVLGPQDPEPFGIFNVDGRSPFLLIGDHAGSTVPFPLQSLGLQPDDFRRHIAIDIGVFGLGQALALLLDAPFVHQPYSRLVIDCNRSPARPDAIPEVSDGTPIPGNRHLSDRARDARSAAIHGPYHATIAALLDTRLATAKETVLLSLHSFTPEMDGMNRPWDVGVLHGSGRPGFAHALRDALADQADLIVGDNEPYAMDETDYTIPFHAFARNLSYAEIEVRQDLVGNPSGQEAWATRLADAARRAAELSSIRDGSGKEPPAPGQERIRGHMA
ncbi:N-formylglutamate amidohydrolase (plasmid) [Novosphingobium resinovorum]|jgi:predicted N-formylglutamate amidohydrolase|uniref:N-formylglutamate amidohydrolase n=1 Tax=Novosphingobium resinovorum TaxID=158500 RepID=A0A1D8AF91_9SPHN|nr:MULTISPECIES: N-formylglutamate amidohydrolase [Sphingomonadaceae]AOR80772.1 N-formylglutamate amidohydrolase [Novosphingobium resinovorum]MBF7015628.1 N-formylglutamate amidohydrolase [Novosphingobium sp. HR1a]WJM30302.1 N-formylglutamate amidohydrolase [Novosphingobium resinovorum]